MYTGWRTSASAVTEGSARSPFHKESTKHKARVPYIAVVVSCLVLLSGSLCPARAVAQKTVGDWAPLTQLYASSLIARPVLAPDATGALHALWWGLAADQAEGTPAVILYARWDGTRWTQPTDVIAGLYGRDIQLPEAVVDAYGTLHVVWMDPQLYHSTAPAWAAEDPHRWSSPQEIGDGKAVFSPCGLAIDPAGTMHVVFAASQSGEIYHTSSADAGQSWSTPSRVYAAPAGASVLFARLVTGSDGALHAVWTLGTLPEGYPPLGVLYSRSEDGGASWSQSIELAGADYGEGAVAASPDGTIHVVVNGRAGVGGRYHRHSGDGGVTWSDPLEIMPPLVGGLTGHPGLSVDSTNMLYFIGHDALFSEWRRGGWSPLQDLRVLTPTSLEYVEQSTLSVVAGNQLHVVFWDGRTRLWHTWRFIDAPAQATISYPTTTSLSLPMETATPEPSIASPTPVAPVMSPVLEPQPPMTGNPLSVVLLGVTPSMLLIGGVFWVLLIRRRA